MFLLSAALSGSQQTHKAKQLLVSNPAAPEAPDGRSGRGSRLSEGEFSALGSLHLFLCCHLHGFLLLSARLVLSYAQPLSS